MRKINMTTYVLVGFLIFPVALLAIGLIGPRLATDSSVKPDLRLRAEGSEDLFVLVHGLSPVEQRWSAIQSTMFDKGHVLRLSYNASRVSNASPEAVSQGIAREVAKAHEATRARRITFVAHSMGALLTRRAILDAQGQPWVQDLKRAVLLAGVNRGWNLAGPPPADVDPLHRLGMRVGHWGARMVNMSALIFSFERGSPFVANLRLQWMKWMRDGAQKVEVVQLIGDIDDIVSRDDNEDLRVMATQGFVQLIVRGTGHAEIVQIEAGKDAGVDEIQLARYRSEKLILAATAPFASLLAINEAQPAKVNDAVTDLFFVLHGIRDLGRWSAKFEQTIEQKYPHMRGKMAIVSPRYGYFGMGPFLFEGVRKRYVRWFMDEYTEALARYPKVDHSRIRFFGHSNGTYLLADALSTYSAMEIERVVFAGSVVPRNFDWSGLTIKDTSDQPARPRVRAVRNYVGTEDWVVALFPRLFELPVVGPVFRNPIGSAGFNGFDDEQTVDNVRFVRGEHSAYDDRIAEIVDYLMGVDTKATEERRGWLGHVMSSWLSVILVWLSLIYAVVWLGGRIVAASPQPAWPALLAYVLMVVMILRTV